MLHTVTVAITLDAENLDHAKELAFEELEYLVGLDNPLTSAEVIEAIAFQE